MFKWFTWNWLLKVATGAAVGVGAPTVLGGGTVAEGILGVLGAIVGHAAEAESQNRVTAASQTATGSVVGVPLSTVTK